MTDHTPTDSTETTETTERNDELPDEALTTPTAVTDGGIDRAVVLLSGGMDSATAAYEAQARGHDLYALHTSYGQRTADRERECARRLAEKLEVADVLEIETDHLAAIGGSSLTDDEMAVDHAALESEEIPDTYVPFRNANLLAMAVSYAEANDCSAVFIGAHSEDFAGYPDCRPAFFEAFERLVEVGTRPETEISIEPPFVDWSKTEIAARGVDLEVPYEHTWSCYRANEPACGTCDSCALRLEAFANVGVRDPIPYRERPVDANVTDR